MRIWIRGGVQYLVEIATVTGRIIDTEQKAVSVLFPLDSVLARGYWEIAQPKPDIRDLLQAAGATKLEAAAFDNLKN